MSPNHGRILIYVWAVEQDELSKRTIPTGDRNTAHPGEDVVIPWVLSKSAVGNRTQETHEPQVFNRYYHMFAKGELYGLVQEATKEIGMQIGPSISTGNPRAARGVDIVQDGWERSNYYIELRCWETRDQKHC